MFLNPITMVFVNQSLETYDDGVTVIEGNGTLAVTSKDQDHYGLSAIFFGAGSLTISGDVTVIPVNENNGYSIYNQKNLSILDDASLRFTNNKGTVENSIGSKKLLLTPQEK